RPPEAQFEAIAPGHCGVEEQFELDRLAAPRRFDGFLAAWTRKEALLKALGSGLQTPPDRVRVLGHRGAPPRVAAPPRRGGACAPPRPVPAGGRKWPSPKPTPACCTFSCVPPPT